MPKEHFCTTETPQKITEISRKCHGKSRKGFFMPITEIVESPSGSNTTLRGCLGLGHKNCYILWMGFAWLGFYPTTFGGRVVVFNGGRAGEWMGGWVGGRGRGPLPKLRVTCLGPVFLLQLGTARACCYRPVDEQSPGPAAGPKPPPGVVVGVSGAGRRGVPALVSASVVMPASSLYLFLQPIRRQWHAMAPSPGSRRYHCMFYLLYDFLCIWVGLCVCVLFCALVG